MNRKKVVIIDDEEDLCHLMKTYLAELDYDVFMANTLQEGLSLMKEVTPDILFIDNNLPDGLGWDKMNYLLTEYPSCKINLISAYQYVPPEIRDSGTVRILEKPFSLQTVKDYL
jgi:two-component system, OmpR family, response regulator